MREAVMTSRQFTTPETTMDETDLETALRQLQESLGDAATLNNIVIAIRANTQRLLEPLKSVLEEARDAIDRTLALLP